MKTNVKKLTRVNTKINTKVVLPDRNNINKHCKLNVCAHGDINSNDIGRIVDIIDDGYAIEFTKSFKVNGHHSEIQTNVIFGAAKDTEIL